MWSLDDGEIVLPAFHPHRTVSSIRSRSEEPWRISWTSTQLQRVMPALIGGAEAVRLNRMRSPGRMVGRRDPSMWTSSGSGKPPPPSCLKLTDCRSREACCWIGGQDWISVPIWRLFRRRVRQNLRVLLVTDEPARGWTRSARLALLVKAVEEAAPQMDGDLSRMSMDLMLDRDPVIGLAQAEAFKRMASSLVGEGNWPRLRAVPDASDLSADSDATT